MKRTAESNITFSLEQQNRENTAFKPGDFLAQTMLCGIFALAILAGILEAIQITVPYGGIVLTTFLTAACLQGIHILGRNKAPLGNAGFTLVPLLGAGFLWKWITNGIAVISNQVLSILGANRGIIYMPLTENQQIDAELSVLLLCVLVSIWLTVLTTYLVKDNHSLTSTCIVIFLLMLNGCLPQTESGIWLLVAGLCIVMILAKAYVGQEKHLWQMAAFLLCIAVIGGVVSYGVANPISPLKKQLTASTRAAVEQWSETQRYGSDDLRAMPMGDFEDLGSLQFSGEPMLKLTGDKWESLYLRGFVGGTFDGDSWEKANGDSLYKLSNAFYWLHEEGFFGQNQIAYSAQTLDENGTKEKLSFTVENVGADSRVYYTPYELTGLTSGGENVLQSSILDDESLQTESWSASRAYKMETLTNQVKGYPSLVYALSKKKDSENLKPFRTAESHYNQFVYKTYTTLSDEERRILQNHLGKTEVKKDSHLDYQKAKEKILNYLNREIKYTTEMQGRNQEVGFLEDFLDISKSGYSVHYATAATLMFRYYGIPARYVEGYLITPDAVKEAKGQKEMVITDNSAHAWVEYYQDGIGWIPFEVTPPYLDVMEQPESLGSTDAGGTYGESGGVGQALEMAEDNYEAPKAEKEAKKTKFPWAKILLGFGILLFLFMAAFMGRHLYKRRKKLQKLWAAFDQENSSRAVVVLFDYILALQEGLGIERRNCSIYAYGVCVKEKINDESALVYEQAAKLYQKAAYSQQRVTSEERQMVADYKDVLLNEIKKQCSLRKRAKLRWIDGLY